MRVAGITVKFTKVQFFCNEIVIFLLYLCTMGNLERGNTFPADISVVGSTIITLHVSRKRSKDALERKMIKLAGERAGKKIRIKNGKL
jgi:hypothetical protein